MSGCFLSELFQARLNEILRKTLNLMAANTQLNVIRFT